MYMLLILVLVGAGMALAVMGVGPPHRLSQIIGGERPRCSIPSWARAPQLDTKIDQDPVLAARLSLWSQRARVIRGNALVIPLDGTLLYVEPIFLQARDAAYPELRLVVLMHGDRMSYAGTFPEALAGLVAGGPSRLPGEAMPGEPRPGGGAAERANQAFDAYLRALGEKRFDEGARQLESLELALPDLVEE